MRIKEEVVRGVMVLYPQGGIIIDEDEELVYKVKEVMAKGHKKILISLVDVPRVDYAGLGTLVRAHSTVSKNGAKLKFSNLVKKVQDLLAVTKLLTVFDVYESEDEAVKSFAS